jgi:hypothetical protein
MLCDICLRKIQGALSKINVQRYGLPLGFFMLKQQVWENSQDIKKWRKPKQTPHFKTT